MAFLLSDSTEGNIVLLWVVCGFFIFLGLSGTYTAVQELRGKYDDIENLELPKWMDEDFSRPEQCYTRKINGYYRLRPTVTYGCVARFLLILAAGSGVLVTALLAGEQDFRDGIDNAGELTVVAMWYLFPLILLVLGLRLYIDSTLGQASVDISHPAFPGKQFEAVILFRSRFRVKRLRTEVVCQEKAEYGVGTDRVTKRHEIITFPVCDVERPQIAHSGEVRRRKLSVPANAMLSFKALNNEIEWFFRVTVDFAFRRNFTHEIPFRVLSPEIFEQEKSRWPI